MFFLWIWVFFLRCGTSTCPTWSSSPTTLSTSQPFIPPTAALPTCPALCWRTSVRAQHSHSFKHNIFSKRCIYNVNERTQCFLSAVKPDPPVHLRVSPKVRSLLVEWSPPTTWANLDIFPLKYQIRFQWEIWGKPKFVNVRKTHSKQSCFFFLLQSLTKKKGLFGEFFVSFFLDCTHLND